MARPLHRDQSPSHPAPIIAAAALARLPARDDLGRLTDAARAAYGLADGPGLIATPGSEIALRLLPFFAPPGGVTVLGPTYESHADAWRAAGREVAEIRSVDELPADAAILVVANPNNPDGRTIRPELLANLADRLAGRSGLLVVDEAFADLVPELSMLPRLAEAPAVVLRSFGKFFGLAGLRLGFVAGPRPLLDVLPAFLETGRCRMRRSSPARRAPRQGLAGADPSPARRDGGDLRGLLARHGLIVVGGTDLFALAEMSDAEALHRELAKRGVWTRAFARHPQWLALRPAAGWRWLGQARASAYGGAGCFERPRGMMTGASSRSTT